MNNPLLRRKRRVGHLAEKGIAKRQGGRLTPGSGSLGTKGDVHQSWEAAEVMNESKATTGESIRLERTWLRKVACEARACGKTPALTVTFCDESGNPKNDGVWVCIPEHVFKELMR